MSDGLALRLIDALPEVAFLLDPDGRVRMCNRAAARLLGRAAAAVAGRPLVELTAGDPAPVRAFLRRCAGSGNPLPGALAFIRDGREVILQARGALVRGNDGRGMVLLRCVERPRASQVFLDLNARLARLADELHRRRRLQSDLQRAIEERDVLLKEVHHRVRNNLQVITSFLSLQAREVDSEAARLALREAQARIRTLALIHGQLYSEAQLSGVELATLVPALCAQLASIYGVGDDRVRFEARLPRWPLDVSAAVPMALLITEAVTNALKHAFPGDRRGRVGIGLHEEGEVRVLSIADDGVGLPGGLAPEGARSLGIRLMHALASQVDGELEIRSAAGVEVRLTLPAEGGTRDSPSA